MRGVFALLCAHCHGDQGQGDVIRRAPSIAGQPKWYLAAQLENFRNGRRGAHPLDTMGSQMRAVTHALEPKQIEALVQQISAMPPRPTLNTLGGDVRRGEQIYAEQCMECHRYNGQGELVFRSSPLTGFQDWYLASALRAFRAGLRGTDAGDLKAVKMREIAGYLSGDDVRDVVTYIARLAAEYPPGR